MPKNTVSRYAQVKVAKAIKKRRFFAGNSSGQASLNPNRKRRQKVLAVAAARSCRFGKSIKSEKIKYPSKRINGLILMSKVSTQLVVAKKNNAFLRPPSGAKAQNKVAKAAKASSVIMPAEAICKRCVGLVSFQLSDVSV